LAIGLAQGSGLIEDDTKLPLVMAPITYLRSALHLWSDHLFGGAVTQSVGLFVPMGPYFALTQFLHVPVWCAERVWLALLLTVGCWGVVRLAEAIGIGRPYARVLAGLAYCTTPIVLSWTTTTAALLAVVLLPWVLRPLVIGSREGSPRRAAGRSGLAVALMGGANATVVFAVLPVAVIWLLTRSPGPRRRALMGWWIVAVGCACLWWVIALVLAGKYGYNYLPYTETAADTTSTTSAFEALRGASYWTDYYALGGALLPGAWTVVSSSVVIVGTTVVTALGLAGLCRRIPERFFLVASMAFGVVVIAVGYAGASGSPIASTVQQLLDTGLTPLRNVSKFAPDVALPLALGLASVLSWEPRRRVGRTRPGVGATALVVAIALLASAAVVIAATPFWRLQLYGSGGFQSIPSYWTQAGQWLQAHQDHRSALLVPGANSAQYTWGDPVDEPLEVVGNTSLVWSDVISLGSNGSTQMLSTVERALDEGTSPPGLAQYLSREGIEYVVERNDLNLTTTGAPPPAQVHQVLSDTPGLTEVSSFGPILPEHQVQVGSLPVYDSQSHLRLRAVEIFRVAGSVSEVRTYPAANPVVVSGDVGSLLPLEGFGLLRGRASVLAGDPLAGQAAKARQATWMATDGNQRRDVGFGAVRDNESYLLGPHESLDSKPVDIPLTYSVVPGTQHQTVEAPIGAASVSSSSFGSSTLSDEPAQGPAAAFDGDPTTAWVANATNDSVGQWLSITFDHPMTLSTIKLTQYVGSPVQPSISEVSISTDRGSVRRVIPESMSAVRVRVPQGSSRFLRITVDAVRPATQPPADGIAAGVAIVNIGIPGLKFQENMQIPHDESAAYSGPQRNPPIVVLNRPLPNTNITLGSSVTDDPNMARTFVLPKPMATGISGFAVPVPGPDLEALLNFLTPASSTLQQVTASSWLGDLPRFRPENLFDNSGSPWIAGLGDPHPSLVISWNGTQTIDSITLTPTSEASRPTEIAISSPTQSPLALSVPPNGGTIDFAPIETNTLRIQILKFTPRKTLSPAYDSEMTIPVGLSSLRVHGSNPPAVPTPDRSYAFMLTCGQGPPITLDGVPTATSVSATLGDLLDLRPVRIYACTPPSGMPFTAGSHSVGAPPSSPPFEVMSLALGNAPSIFKSAVPLAARSARVEQWEAASRLIGVGAGPATYLVIPQNFNTAWVATLGGQALTPVRIDGWQQGYIVPAGRAGTVHLTMTPDTVFHLGLWLGAALLCALLLLTLLPTRRSPDDPTGPRPLPSFWLLAAGTVLALVLVGGPLALVALPLLWVARRWGGGVLAVVAWVAFVGAGVAVAWHAGALPTTMTGAFGQPAQIASVVAFAAVLCAAAGDRSLPRRRQKSSADRSVPVVVSHEIP